MQINILLKIFMSKKQDNDYAPSQLYISQDNLKYISLPYNTTHKHTYGNMIRPIVYFNRVGRKATGEGDLWYMAVINPYREGYYPREKETSS